MGMKKTILHPLDTYIDLYSYLSKGQHTETDTKKYLENNGRSNTNARRCVASARDGEMPFITVEDGKVSLDLKAFIFKNGFEVRVQKQDLMALGQ